MNPYPGLRPFKREEALFYVGREIVQKQVVLRVDLSPLTVLFARSGVGKSSFLTCRFIPSLQGSRQVLYVNEWGSDHSEKLIDNAIDSLTNEKRKGAQEKPLLVLDQFEDVFKINYQPQRLWESIAAVANVHDAPVHLLISMREEWLGAWGDATDYLPDALGTTVRLAPLSESDVIRAVVRPPTIEGTVGVTEELARVLLHDLSTFNPFGLGDKYVELGLLQLVCHQLWEIADQEDKIMNVALYNRLDRADSIIRDYVWRELGNAGEANARFTSYDRVLWSGLTRYFILAPGVKSIMTTEGLLRKLRITDLGIAGRAVVHRMGGREAEKYMETQPEKRGEPPASLKTWAADLFTKGKEAGFLKDQSGSESDARLYELTHDSLGNIFQQFSFEFERWISKRVGVLLGGLVVGLVGLPFFGWHVLEVGLEKALADLHHFTVIMLAYIALYLLSMKILWFVWRIIGYPMIRRLCKGRVFMKNLDKSGGDPEAW